MAMLAMHTSSTSCTVSCAKPPVAATLAAPTSSEAPAAQRQPFLIAKPSTAPAVHIDGRVGPPASMRAWVSTTGVSRIPASATASSTARKSGVHRSAPETRRTVASVHTARTAR